MGRLEGLARSAAKWYILACGCARTVMRSRIARLVCLPHARMYRMAGKWVNVESIGSYFESLSDPRHTRNRKHLLVDIVVIAVCGMLRGSDGPTAIHRWAENRRGWLEQFLSLPNGIPSRDCIRRLLMALKPEAFQKWFQDWISHAIRTDDSSPDRLGAIHAKTCRRCPRAAPQRRTMHLRPAPASVGGVASVQ